MDTKLCVSRLLEKLHDSIDLGLKVDFVSGCLAISDGGACYLTFMHVNGIVAPILFPPLSRSGGSHFAKMPLCILSH